MNPKRARILKKSESGTGPIMYWMDRERRTQDNWAFHHAQDIATKQEESLIVIYVLPKTFLESSWRQQHFMIEGLKEIKESLKKKDIGFFACAGDPSEEVPKLIKKWKVSTLVTDFSPLKVPRKWRKEITKLIDIPFIEVDSRNIVPCWEASPKLEYAAYTIRPKIHKQLQEYLDDFPKVQKQKKAWEIKTPEVHWKKIIKELDIDMKVEPVDWIKPGEKAALKMLEKFIKEKKNIYNNGRNDPNEDAQSNLSPYLHYGMISAQRVALMTIGMDTFIEELVVRRELADNYCFYEPNYDNFKGFHAWAQKTLNEHRADEREFLYSRKEFEEAKTHDPLWNAAQTEMLKTGKMHGFMRMYWAKKILEWTKNPEEAQRIAIYLNDKYELDGRDPNGYAGIAWSIGGVHDRAWGEREVFGKVRYMNFKGCKRKFNVKKYMETHLGKEQVELF